MWKKLDMITIWNIKYLKQLEQFSSVQHKIIQAENRKAKNVTMFCDAWPPGKNPSQCKLSYVSMSGEWLAEIHQVFF